MPGKIMLMAESSRRCDFNAPIDYRGIRLGWNDHSEGSPIRMAPPRCCQRRETAAITARQGIEDRTRSHCFSTRSRIMVLSVCCTRRVVIGLRRSLALASVCLIGWVLMAMGSQTAHEADRSRAPAAQSRVPHVVFVTGDEEYRSEESMPMLARMLHRDYGFKVTVCYAVGKDGTIDPNNLGNIAGLEAVDHADLLVMFTRFRKLPEEQLRHIVQ